MKPENTALSIEFLMLNDLLRMKAIDEHLYAMAVQKIQGITTNRSGESGTLATA